jgi:hypothetical protein
MSSSSYGNPRGRADETNQGDLRRAIVRWRAHFADVDWPFTLQDDICRYVLPQYTLPDDRVYRWAMYDLLAELLINGEVALDFPKCKVDQDRDEISEIIVHHSHSQPSISADRLSAMGLLRLYIPVLWSKSNSSHQRSTLSSGHWRAGRQVFYAYHWLVRPDASTQRLLDDHEIGWHAGDWRVNRRSVAVCLAGDYSSRMPSANALGMLSQICDHYPGAEVRPHCHINPRTACPGRWARQQNLAVMLPRAGLKEA